MCELAFSRASTPACTVKVLPIEKEANDAILASNPTNPNIGTIDTLLYLRNHTLKSMTNVQLHLVLGGDTFADLVVGRWKRHKDVRILLLLVFAEAQ